MYVQMTEAMVFQGMVTTVIEELAEKSEQHV